MSEIVMVGGNNYKVQKEQDGSISLLRYNDKFGIWVKVRFSGSDEKIAEVIKDTLIDEYIKNAAMGAIEGVLNYPLQSESPSVKMTSHLKREAV